MIKNFPQLLEPTFNKRPPVHGVYHRIDTADHPPSRAKRRPLIADATKAAEGKRIWKQMEDGVIERVKPGANTDWASALHLANKPGGGVRPCTDFRDLNKKTVLDAYSLPLLKDFTHKIYGSTHFSRVDLKSAFLIYPYGPPTNTRQPRWTRGVELGYTTAYLSVWPLVQGHGSASSNTSSRV